MADDVLAVLDELGLERVKLVGHDWGGWIGFLLALKAPQRFERYLALNILHPWVRLRDMAPHLWRFWYQWMILSPGIGYGLHRSGRFIPRVLVGGSSVKEVWDDETVHAFSDTFTRPDYARAGVQMYRVFNLKEVRAIMRGGYFGKRLTVPTLLLFGEDDFALKADLLDGYEEPRRRDGGRARPRLRPLHRRRAPRPGRRAGGGVPAHSSVQRSRSA